jgi:ferredoxin-thioredoxin reductase catalytic subunit
MELANYQQVLRDHAARQGLIMNPDWEIVRPLLEGLLVNGARYGLRTCPCRLAHGQQAKDRDIVCPCVYARPDVDEYGACYCHLFVSQGWIDGQVPHRQIPERRPVDKVLGLD